MEVTSTDEDALPEPAPEKAPRKSRKAAAS
jgi:hypothetical protein